MKKYSKAQGRTVNGWKGAQKNKESIILMRNGLKRKFKKAEAKEVNRK